MKKIYNIKTMQLNTLYNLLVYLEFNTQCYPYDYKKKYKLSANQYNVFNTFLEHELVEKYYMKRKYPYFKLTKKGRELLKLIGLIFV